ncbi:MAG: outer membrane beta-barrel protein [Hyphomicrobiales bacterium]|nr:outer membrane beta-barrel protein [Hyphomicrobiales bacterium]
MTMTKLLGAAAAVAMFAGAAQAADVEAAPDSPSWTGGYIGVVGGYGWGDSGYESSAVASGTLSPILVEQDGSVDFEGFLIGGQLGYDFDFGNGFVLGVAGDMSWSDMDGTKCVQFPVCTGSPDDTHSYADVEWLATIRGRAGFTTGSMLIYGTGGLAIAGAEATITYVDGTLDTPRSDSNTHYGWVIGAGAEFMVTENMSLGAEYLHVDLGSEDYTFPGPGGGLDVRSESDLQIDIVRASLNLRF